MALYEESITESMRPFLFAYVAEVNSVRKIVLNRTEQSLHSLNLIAKISIRRPCVLTDQPRRSKWFQSRRDAGEAPFLLENEGRFLGNFPYCFHRKETLLCALPCLSP